MTFLSRLLMSSKSARWRVRALVRSSHFVAAVVASAFAPSCLFPEPPHWDSKPTRPQLVDPIPLTSQFVVISTDPSNNGQTFRVTELSEDEGHALRVVWYLNYKLSNERYLNSRDIAAGSQDQPKLISVNYTPAEKTAMCVPFTLVVTHIENDSNADNHHPIDDSDVATVTWWLNVTNSTSAALTVDQCSSLGGLSQ